MGKSAVREVGFARSLNIHEGRKTIPKTVAVTCDNCGKDLSETGNMEDWRILLANDPIPVYGHLGEAVMVTYMWIPPPLSQDRYFCGKKCLKEWVAKEV